MLDCLAATQNAFRGSAMNSVNRQDEVPDLIDWDTELPIIITPLVSEQLSQSAVPSTSGACGLGIANLKLTSRVNGETKATNAPSASESSSGTPTNAPNAGEEYEDWTACDAHGGPPKLSVWVDYAELPAQLWQRHEPKFNPPAKSFTGVFYRRIVIDGLSLALLCKQRVDEECWDVLSVVVRSLFYWTARGHPTVVCFPSGKEVPALKDGQMAAFKAGVNKLVNAHLLYRFRDPDRMEWYRSYADEYGAALVTQTSRFIQAQRQDGRREMPKRIVTPYVHRDGTAVFFPDCNPATSRGSNLFDNVCVRAEQLKQDITREDFDMFYAQQLPFGEQVRRLKLLYDMLPSDSRYSEQAALAKILELLPLDKLNNTKYDPNSVDSFFMCHNCWQSQDEMQATYRQKDGRVQYEGDVGRQGNEHSLFPGTSKAAEKLSVSVDCDEPKIPHERTYPKYLPERSFDGVFLRPVVIDVIGLARICEAAVYPPSWNLLSIVVRSLFYWTARGHRTVAILPHKCTHVPGVREEQFSEFIAGLRKLQNANLLLVFKVEHRMEWIQKHVDREHAVLLTETRGWRKAHDLDENRKLPKRIFTPFMQAEGTAMFFPETNPVDSHHGTPLSMAVVVTADRLKHTVTTKEQFDEFMEKQLTLRNQILQLELLYRMLPPDARFAETAVLNKIRGYDGNGSAL
ncbi:hypothetical protein AAVH_09858 [Aphelenchoides avenae]|nr:hypothetical protein AAVH_09858 [Aphelenchus avenae]